MISKCKQKIEVCRPKVNIVLTPFFKNVKLNPDIIQTREHGSHVQRKINGLNLEYFLFRLFDLHIFHSLKYLRSLTLRCKDIGIRN